MFETTNQNVSVAVTMGGSKSQTNFHMVHQLFTCKSWNMFDVQFST
jgi:hypothetical protein